jgi:hypothetical protein
MDWDAVGAIADLASAVMVAMSLVYLAVQVREFRRQAEIDLNMRFLENADRARTEIWTNAEVAAFLERCLSTTDPLPALDRARYAAYVNQRLWAYVQVHRYRGSAKDWREILEVLAPMIRSPAGREIWTDSRAQFPAEFQLEIDALLGASRSRS